MIKSWKTCNISCLKFSLKNHEGVEDRLVQKEAKDGKFSIRSCFSPYQEKRERGLRSPFISDRSGPQMVSIGLRLAEPFPYAFVALSGKQGTEWSSTTKVFWFKD